MQCFRLFLERKENYMANVLSSLWLEMKRELILPVWSGKLDLKVLKLIKSLLALKEYFMATDRNKPHTPFQANKLRC
jgi:hypothetical protein